MQDGHAEGYSSLGSVGSILEELLPIESIKFKVYDFRVSRIIVVIGSSKIITSYFLVEVKVMRLIRLS